MPNFVPFQNERRWKRDRLYLEMETQKACNQDTFIMNDHPAKSKLFWAGPATDGAILYSDSSIRLCG